MNGLICSTSFTMGEFFLTAHAQFVATERNIKLSWIEAVLTQPEITEKDPKDQELIHSLGKISENDGRVLRIIHSQTQPMRVVTVYFDRSMRGKL